MIVGVLLIGPSKMLQLPNSQALVILGLCLGGFGRGLIDGLPSLDAMKGGTRAFPLKRS